MDRRPKSILSGTSVTRIALVFAAMTRSVPVAWFLFLCILLGGEASAVELFQPSDQELDLVRVNLITETHGVKDTVEINGKTVTDYSPILIQVFSSTGIVLDGKGHIMTFLGYHWVDISSQNSRVEITGDEGQKWPGKMIGIDQLSGVAVVQSLGGKLKKTPLCTDCEIKDGVTIIAPILGRRGPSQFHEAQILSVGGDNGISAQGSWTIKMNRPFPEIGLPVLTADHRILGFVASRDATGFRTVVYPISSLLSSAQRILKEGGDIRTGWLGVFLADSQPSGASGVRIQAVEPDSPADRAGLLSEDVLFKYNGQKIRDARQFIQLVQHTPIGSLAALEIVRQGSPMKLGALVDSRKPRPARGRLAFSLPGGFNAQAAGTISGPKRLIPQPMVGLDTLILTPQLAEALQIPKQTGLLVIEVAKRMPADLAGVLVGDLIVAMDGQPIKDASGFASHMQTRDWGALMELRILRKGVELPITIRMPDQGR